MSRKVLLPIPMTLSPTSLEVLVSEGELHLPGDSTNIPLNWKLIFPLVFGLLMSLNKQTKKGITALGRMIDPDYHEDSGLLTIGLLLHSGGKKGYVWN